MENGGVGLIYTNGIGGMPQQTGAAETTGAAAASRAAKTESGSLRMNSASINSGGTDGTKLSTTAGLITQAFASSDVRSAKVAAMQQSIAAGTYSISSLDIANKVMTALLQ